MDLRLYSKDPAVQLEALLEQAHRALDMRGVPRAPRKEEEDDSQSG